MSPLSHNLTLDHPDEYVPVLLFGNLIPNDFLTIDAANGGAQAHIHQDELVLDYERVVTMIEGRN